jgi:aminoglycoside phosphotransferase (APT) family kinase protein
VQVLLDVVNAQHGTSFTVCGYLAGGTRGAWQIAEPGGRRAVLKRGWGQHLDRITPIADALQARGYPIPHIVLGGTTPNGESYHVQEFISGEPIARLTPNLLRQLLRLVELQADLRPQTDQDWSTYVEHVVFRGESGWTPALRGHSTATAELLAAIERATRPFVRTRLPIDDAVHGDLGAYNVLARDGQITAVIDYAAIGRGTRAIDLAILLGQEYDELDDRMRAELSTRVHRIAAPAGAAICIAYQIVNLVAYAIQAHPPSSLPRYVARGWRMLHDLQQL